MVIGIEVCVCMTFSVVELYINDNDSVTLVASVLFGSDSLDVVSAVVVGLEFMSYQAFIIVFLDSFVFVSDTLSLQMSSEINLKFSIML